jgi:hypothetical protein
MVVGVKQFRSAQHLLAFGDARGSLGSGTALVEGAAPLEKGGQGQGGYQSDRYDGDNKGKPKSPRWKRIPKVRPKRKRQADELHREYFCIGKAI